MSFMLLVAATVALNTLAQVMLKLGAGRVFFNPYLVGGILTYGLSALMYITVLGRLNLSVAYPLIIGLTIVATALAGVHLFQERLEPAGWAGIVLVLCGIGAITSARP